MSRLLNLEEAARFKLMLAAYSLHENTLEQFRNSRFAVIAGPAGAGKDTLRENLIDKHPDIYLPILSTTTRPPRLGEKDGVTYHFREVEEVEKGVERREFFQAELVHDQQVSCLHISEIQKLGQGMVGLSILITETEKKLRTIKPDLKTIFLIPPNHEVLASRMQAERKLDQPEIDRRLAAAKSEIAHALASPHYYCLVSDTEGRVSRRSHEYLHSDNRNDADDEHARQTMQQIMLNL